MSGGLSFHNHQPKQLLDAQLLRQIIQTLLKDLLAKEDYDLGVHVITSTAMAELNARFLRHPGPTDVITFDYAEPTMGNGALHGEIFVCLAVARAQANLFRTTWQSELVRYVIHGILHLCGHDDHEPAARRQMKKEENQKLRQLSQRFDFLEVSKRPKSSKRDRGRYARSRSRPNHDSTDAS